MANKQKAAGVAFGGGAVLSLGLYLAGLLVVALLAVREMLPEQRLFPAVAVVCVLASAVGSWFCVRRSPLGTLPSGLLCALAFAAVLTAVGAVFWQGITWAGQGGVLLACTLGGGACAGLLGSRKGRRVKRKPKRR